MVSAAMNKLDKRATSLETGKREVEIPLAKTVFDPTQPRQAFHHPDGQVAESDNTALAELATTIDSQGLIQAITVEELPDGTYRVVVGERRTRAHILLGKTTIRAIIKNDLSKPKKRLIYQLTENVNRQDLSDAELAENIARLMEGEDGEEPLKQSEIAAAFGKSEGWVSRYVKYGSEELQRVWVKPGIADSVEKVYRLSLLPKHMQVDIIRRVNLPPGDPDRLERPLNRAWIDQLADQAKIQRRATPPSPQRSTPPPAPQAAANASELVPPGAGSVDQTVTDLAAQGQQQKPQATASGSVSGTPKYTLPESARAKILNNAPSYTESNAPGNTPALPPVNCRASVSSLAALLKALETNPKALDATEGLQCSITIPGGLAQAIANLLSGMIVDAREVPATVQNLLARL